VELKRFLDELNTQGSNRKIFVSPNPPEKGFQGMDPLGERSVSGRFGEV